MKSYALRVVILLLALGLIFLAQPQPRRASSGTILLQKPANTTSFIETQAGIAAYYQPSNQPINLAAIRPLLRTVTLDSPTYLIGTLPLTGYTESEDVLIYVHESGPVLAYYPKSFVTARIFDWGSGLTVTRLQTALASIANVLGDQIPNPTYYHFQYPQATRLLLAAKSQSGSMYITPPSGVDYYEFSYNLNTTLSCLCTPVRGWFVVDGTIIVAHSCLVTPSTTYGRLTGGLSPDTEHTITFDVSCGSGRAGMAILFGPQQAAIDLRNADSSTETGLTASVELLSYLRQTELFVMVSGASGAHPQALAAPILQSIFILDLPLIRR